MSSLNCIIKLQIIFQSLRKHTHPITHIQSQYLSQPLQNRKNNVKNRKKRKKAQISSNKKNFEAYLGPDSLQ
jgi:hypothetical protein